MLWTYTINYLGWLAAWAIAVGILFYARPRSGDWNRLISIALVTLLGGGFVVALYAVVLFGIASKI